jgi:hypothetical protein
MLKIFFLSGTADGKSTMKNAEIAGATSVSSRYWHRVGVFGAAAGESLDGGLTRSASIAIPFFDPIRTLELPAALQQFRQGQGIVMGTEDERPITVEVGAFNELICTPRMSGAG